MSDSGIDVVVVNWNAGDHLRRCVESVLALAAANPGLTLTVVDNASTDSSLSQLPQNPALRVIRNERNLGFAAACNQGARAGKSKYILFLNPDMILTDPAALTRPIETIQAEPSVGIVGIQLRDEDGAVTRSCTRFPTARRVLGWSFGLDRFLPRFFDPQFMTDFDHSKSRDVDVVMGAFFFVPRMLFDRLGGFDERFFVYYEEVDFARRARIIGYSSRFLADVSATHVGHGTTEGIRAIRYFLVSRSRVQYGAAHFGPMGRLASTISTIVFEPLIRLAFALASGNFAGAMQTAQGARMLLGWAAAGMPSPEVNKTKFA